MNKVKESELISKDFPVPAELRKSYGNFSCDICPIESSGLHYILVLNFTKPGLTGLPECDMDKIKASEFCRDCWESHAVTVQHWYENEYLEISNE